ncbi:MAG: cob(I)yrinic acid a,c-diamide adenosyltransferase [Spirochaetaceae bacterium]|nr:cob(I)yrinic acid a,c-diamide adenosyltransferase [Spirochaetaceae bacterium]
MIEFNKITTREGDSGETSLTDGIKYPKDNSVFEVLGDIDELHSFLGLLKAGLTVNTEKEEIDWIEHCLIRIGGMIALSPDHPAFNKIDLVGEVDLEKLETRQKAIMDRINLPPLFITFGGSENGARADIARAVCRRSERHLVKLIREEEMNHLGDALRFLNRLSDWLFIKARELDSFQEKIS